MIVTPGVVSPIDDIPETLLGLLGLSGVTSIWAKGITTQYVNQGLNKKPVKSQKKLMRTTLLTGLLAFRNFSERTAECLNLQKCRCSCLLLLQ
jgi:hypothetical protein